MLTNYQIEEEEEEEEEEVIFEFDDEDGLE